MSKIFLRTSVAVMVFVAQSAQASPQCDGVQAVGGSCNGTDLPTKIGTIIDQLFIVAGAIAVLIMVVGGIRYITSTGDATRIQAAKNTILYAVFGLIVVILARAIVGYVISNIA